MSKEIYRPGVQVFYENDKTGWAIGTLKEYGAVSKVEENGQEFKVKKDQVHIHTEGAYDKGFDDLFGMGDLHQSTLLYCLKARYEQSDMMYTRMGEIIISINPFKAQPYNQMDRMKAHTEGKWDCPHTWEVAHKAYKKIILMNGRNQSILVSGESGAGKTETAKTLIDYLGVMSSANTCTAIQKSLAEGVNKKLRASNPILESFGNAKTCRNDNSSRFGKYIKLFFDKQSGVLIGAQMVHYLLEKSRIVTQNEGERGYHVFYEMLAGMSAEQKKKYGNLTKAQDYASLNKGKQFIREMNGRVTEDTSEFKNLMQAFKDTGITDAEVDQVFRVLGAILNLSNVKYVNDDATGQAKITNPELVKVVAGLLKVDATKFTEGLLVKTRTNIMTQNADVAEAQDMRDAVSKALYCGVFDWLVAKLNVLIAPNDAQMQGEVRYIGLLDIFGFENFKINSFEQFCINFTNESLQNHYNKYTFVQDEAECAAEGIKCPQVDYPNNQPCLDMLQAKGGVMPLLDAECAYRLGTDGQFTEKAWTAHGESKYFDKPKASVTDRFTVNHYAASVQYMTPGWLEKNSDTLKDDMRSACNSSSCKFVAGLVGAEDKAAKTKPTVSSKFVKQLDSLKEELNSTDSHFIRTVKPNPQNKAGRVDNQYVMTQLTSAGVIETIIMKRAGYPVRQLHRDFWLRYRIIAPKSVKKKFPAGKHPSDDELKDVCREIADFWCMVLNAKKPHFDIGHTKVFMKAKVNDGLEICRNRKVCQLLPRCFPYLIKWAMNFKVKKAAEEKRRKEQEEQMRREHEQAEKNRAKGGVSQAAKGQDSAQGKLFTKLCELFPHFDLPVISGITDETTDEKIATEFLLDMQKQLVSGALPLNVKALFDEAKLSNATQETLIKKGITEREKLFALTTDKMKKMGFTSEECDNLAAILIRQQGGWVVNQRLNVLMGAQGRNEKQQKKEMENFEKAAIKVKKNLQDHLNGKAKMDVSIRSMSNINAMVPAHDEQQVAHFVSMGFTKDRAIKALQKHNNDANKAADMLLTAG